MRRSLVPAVCAVALLTGCSSAGSGTASAAPDTATTSPASSASSASSGRVGTGCPAPASGRPTGAPARANSAPTLDVDGDGRPDTVWIDAQSPAGGFPFGITTASGGVFSADFDSASPVERSVLVADVTGTGEFIALASDGRQVLLWAVSRCSLVPVQNVQGRQYAFDLGFTAFGTGVGCADIDGDGVRDLVGLKADGTSITSTAVTLDGDRATNGTSRTIADASPELIDRAHQVTCGDLTMARDGVRAPQ
jgi:hypothetical protein